MGYVGGKNKTKNTKSYKPKAKKTKKSYKKRYSPDNATKDLLIKGPMKSISQFNPFPRRWVCKMRYSDTLTLTTGSGGVFGTSVNFALNDIYDPYTAFGGHSAYGFDQMKTLYSRFIVRGCLVEITFSDPSVDGLVAGCLVQSHSGVGSISGISVDYIKEQPYSWTKCINNTGSQIVKFKQYFPVHSIEGLSKVQYETNLASYSGTGSSAPSYVPFIQLGAASDRAASGETLISRVMLTYYAEWYMPILQAHS
ncbi:MAG: capsid protein [Cressdnaviricota sp.]|nr:MAG: capsid protein [Cressdnaviricota sp.]